MRLWSWFWSVVKDIRGINEMTIQFLKDYLL